MVYIRDYVIYIYRILVSNRLWLGMLDRVVSIHLDLFLHSFYENKIIETQLRIVFHNDRYLCIGKRIICKNMICFNQVTKSRVNVECWKQNSNWMFGDLLKDICLRLQISGSSNWGVIGDWSDSFSNRWKIIGDRFLKGMFMVTERSITVWRLDGTNLANVLGLKTSIRDKPSSPLRRPPKASLWSVWSQRGFNCSKQKFLVTKSSTQPPWNLCNMDGLLNERLFWIFRYRCFEFPGYRKFDLPISVTVIRFTDISNSTDFPISVNKFIAWYPLFDFPISENHFDLPILENHPIYRYQKL